jgi:kynurenine formamidase
MKIIDITGPIYDNMWYYGDPLKRFKLSKREIEHAGEKYTIDVFDGMSANTGTYIETTGSTKGHTLDDIPIERLIELNTYVLQIPYEELKIKDKRPYVSLQDVERAEKEEIQPGSAILLSTGYGRNWKRDDYMERCWFFTKEAMLHICESKPYLLGGDSPTWENAVHPEGVFEPFIESKALMLSSCVNLEKITKFRVKLTVLYLKISNLRANCPCRAVVIED